MAIVVRDDDGVYHNITNRGLHPTASCGKSFNPVTNPTQTCDDASQLSPICSDCNWPHDILDD